MAYWKWINYFVGLMKLNAEDEKLCCTQSQPFADPVVQGEKLARVFKYGMVANCTFRYSAIYYSR